MPEPRQITINARKYDGSIRRSWTAGLVKEGPDLFAAVGIFDQAVLHNDLGLIDAGTVSFEYFWPDRWYNVFRFVGPDGALRNYYCNIAMPPVVEADVLAFTDLDIDVVIWPDGRHEVLDLEDFEVNSARFGYPDDIRERAQAALVELLSAIDRREFPFDKATDASMSSI